MVNVSLDSRYDRISLVCGIEEERGQLPNSNTAVRKGEGLALAFLGVPIGPQKSRSNLEDDVGSVVFKKEKQSPGARSPCPGSRASPVRI